MKTFWFVFSMIVIAILQLSFFAANDWTRITLHLVLVIAVYLVVATKFERAIWWSFGGGLILDTGYVTPYGTETIALVLTIIAVYFFFRHYVTNRSLASLLLLVAAGTIIHGILSLGIGFTLHALIGAERLYLTPSVQFLAMFYRIVGNLSLAIVLVLSVRLVLPTYAFQQRTTHIRDRV